MGDGERDGVIALSNPFQKAILALTLNPSIEDARTNGRSKQPVTRSMQAAGRSKGDHAPNGYAVKNSS